jgi:fermentation-respiration switch protein FrsA (DUF1100 family)
MHDHYALSANIGKLSRAFSVQINTIYFIIFITVFIILLFVFYPQVESYFIFYPQRHYDMHPSERGMNYEDGFFYAEDKTRLHGWFFPGEKNAPVVLFFHGNAGNISHRLDNIRLLLKERLQVFILSYRGYGESSGRPSEKGLYKDGLAAYDFLVNQKHVRPEKIVLFGRSLGASVATEVALNRKVRCLVIESAFTSTKDMAKTIWLFKPIAFISPAHYNNLKRIGHIHVPKLVVHGENDEIVPFKMGQELYDAASGPKYLYTIKGAGHNDTYLVGGKKYFETLARFVRNAKP